MMKRIIFFLMLTFSFSFVDASYSYHDFDKRQVVSVSSYYPVKQDKTVENSTLVFLLSLLVVAIGTYTIYGIGAVIIVPILTYFITNGNKKAFKISILGSLAGLCLGLLIFSILH